MKENWTHSLNLFKLIIFIAILAHFIGLSWYTLGRWEIEYGETQTWLHLYDVIDTDWKM
jgi:hypothetical protein